MFHHSIRRLVLVVSLTLIMSYSLTSVLTLAQTVIATVPVGNSPQGVAVNPVTNLIYVTNVASDTISVIDGSTNTVRANVSVAHGTAPSATAVNMATNRIYVANTLGSNVSVIDGPSNTVVATIPVGVKPSAVAVNPLTNRIYVANRETADVSVINGNTNTVIGITPLPQAGPLDIAVNPSTNRVYVANSGTNSVAVLDGTNNAVVGNIAIGSLSTGLAVNSATNRIYVASSGQTGAAVSVIDGTSNAVIVTIPIQANPRGVAVNASTNRTYVVSQIAPNGVLIIDGASNTVIGTVPVGNDPQRVDSDPATDRFYVTNGTSNNVSVVQDVTASPPPAGQVSTWFFAEGSSQPPFDTWFLVENPTTQTANVTFTFFLQPAGTVTRSFVVGPTSRFSLFANETIPNVAFSTRIDSNVPVFAERSMYVGYDGDVVTGIPAPSTVWLFAEGATVTPFHTWLLLQNPNDVPAATTITYLLESGQNVPQTLTLPPNSRTSIFVNQVLPNAAFSSRVQSDQPIIAERAMYRFPGNAATVNSGVNNPSSAWYFAEGRTSFQGLAADTFLLLQNPNPTQATATITLFGTDGRTTAFPVAVLPSSRLTINLNPIFGGSFGIRVTSDLPIIAERSIFFGNEPRGAYSTQGATALATFWHLAEGETRAPFDERITILNPMANSTMDVRIDFELANGQVVPAFFNVAANSKLEVEVGRIVTGANSATITTSIPSVVERTMFISKLGSKGAHDTIGFPMSQPLR